ncbi:MAG: 3'-5' exonuclease [Anaerolineaceae bacterium]|nr:3'-5' exonuclease [Anaerolineaceae bacterium]NTV36382.1 3'-5' exonuclease [Anaerolineaceae bacterium]
MAAPTPPTRQAAIDLAKSIVAQKPVYLDTETTGVERDDEIVEIAIVEWDGSVLYESYVRPSRPIPAQATRIHGIKDADVQGAKPWPVLWQSIRNLMVGRLLATYNSDFDLRMMQQSQARYRLPWRETFNAIDIMKVYADYKGVWDPNRRSMRYFKLEEAGAFFNINIPNAHRAAADTLLARAVLHSIAELPY